MGIYSHTRGSCKGNTVKIADEGRGSRKRDTVMYAFLLAFINLMGTLSMFIFLFFYVYAAENKRHSVLLRSTERKLWRG